MQEMWVWSLGWEDLLEKEMATHFCILVWEIPWTEEPDSAPLYGVSEKSVRTQWLNNNNPEVDNGIVLSP